jgi:hypothetical protein
MLYRAEVLIVVPPTALPMRGFLEYFLRRKDTLGFWVDTTFAYPKALHTLPRGELDPTGPHAGAFDDCF